MLDTTQLRALKVISPTHFSFITETGDGQFYAAGGGRYRVEGSTYTEIIQYGSVPEMIGEGYPFSYRIEGDLWFHEGEENGVHIEEVWRRVR